MTIYTAIADSDVDPESPGTTTLFTRLRDNPIAITEGASGAPQHALASLSTEVQRVLYGASGLSVLFPSAQPDRVAHADSGVAAQYAVDGNVYYFASTRAGATQIGRTVWYYPYHEILGIQQGVASVKNVLSSALTIRITAELRRYSDDVCQVRLLKDGVVTDTQGVTGTGTVNVTFANQSIAAGEDVIFEIQGQIGAGSGDDVLMINGIFAVAI